MSREAGNAVTGFLAENCETEPNFSAACRGLLGNALFDRIMTREDIDLIALPRNEQQTVLMAFVPKKIAQLVHEQGWRVVTTRNLRYGATGAHAPIVSWIIEFHWDARASKTPAAVYRAALRAILSGVGQIAEDGTIS